jgi:hypothetical protein
MKRHLIGTVLALAMVAIVPADMQHSIRAASQQERVWANMKGTIKSIDENLLVIDPLNNGKSQTSFALGPDVKRTGALTTGAPVTVRFYLENGKRVVTEVTGKSAK